MSNVRDPKSFNEYKKCFKKMGHFTQTAQKWLKLTPHTSQKEALLYNNKSNKTNIIKFVTSTATAKTKI